MPKPEEDLVSFHPVYLNAGLAAKLHEVKMQQKDVAFSQTELSLLEQVSHQRVSILLKAITSKSEKTLARQKELVEFLAHQA